MTLDETLARLTGLLTGVDRLGVAYSGGVDSTVLLGLAARVLGTTDVVAVLGVSPSLAGAEREAAHEVAAGLGVRVVGAATTAGVPVPGFSSALAYYDTVRADRLPAALVQGLRDNFGAHTYQRTDRDGTFHTLWSGDRTEIDADAHPKPREAGA